MVVGSGTRGTLKAGVTPTQQPTKTEQKVDCPGAEGRVNIIKPGHWSRRRNRCGSLPRRGNAGDTSTDTSAPRRNILAEVIKDTEETNAEGHHGPSQGTHSGCRRRKAAATWTRARGPGRYEEVRGHRDELGPEERGRNGRTQVRGTTMRKCSRSGSDDGGDEDADGGRREGGERRGRR